MTTYNITNAQTLRSVSPARTGGDIYNINGGSLTIDQDTRYGQGGGAAFSLGNITLSATLGGTLDIDGRFVRLIPFTGGSGTITAGATITMGGATGVVIGLYSAINTAPVLTGVAAGFIKVTAWNGVAFPTSGAFTQAGYTFTINGASKAGWIELVGDEAATITAVRLGLVRARGEWFEVANTSGSNATTYQLPTNGSVQYFAGCYVEKTASSGDFEFYPCAGSLVAASSTATDAVRGKVCWISTAGVLRLGSDGTNAVGYVPPAGLRIVIPNIITANCTTAARGTNALPNATLATRYDFKSTGGGRIEIDKMHLAWYPSFTQAFSLQLTNTMINDQLQVAELASPIAWAKVGVGQTAAQSQTALAVSLCFAGGTATDCVWSRAAMAASGNFAVTMADCLGFTFTGFKARPFVRGANANTGAMSLARVKSCTWTAPVLSGKVVEITCENNTFTNTTYYDAPGAATGTLNGYAAFEPSSGTKGTKIDSVSFGGLTNVQPYLGLLVIGAAGCSGIKLRNIGASPSSPLSLGSANVSAYLFQIANGAAATDVKVQRCFVSGTRTSLYALDNSSSGVVLENVQGDDADAPVPVALNMTGKAVRCLNSQAAQTGVYGTHFTSQFDSATAGRIALLMNEPTASTASQVTLSGGASFTSAGGLYMPTIGMQALFSMPFKPLGFTAFQNAAAVMAGGTIGNYTLEYQIDTGAGLSAWKALTGANLSAEAISASAGFGFNIRITTAVANTTAITSLHVLLSTSAVAQANYYPLDTNTVTLTGLQPGSDVVLLQAGTTTILAQADALAGTSYSYTYSGAQSVDVGVIKEGLQPLYLRGLALGLQDASIPIQQVFDRNFI